MIMVRLACISLNYIFGRSTYRLVYFLDSDIEEVVRDIPKETSPTIAQLFNEGFSDLDEEDGLEAATGPKRPPFAIPIY